MTTFAITSIVKKLSEIYCMLNLLLLVIIFLSGICGLIYEIVWLRMLGLIFGTTPYAASIVLAAFMGGLALGNFYFGRRSDLTTKNPLFLYAVLETGIGISAFCVPFVFDSMSFIIGFIPESVPSFVFGIIQFLIVFIALLIPTTLMGGTLPALSRVFIKSIADLGKGTGKLYGVNTAGAVVGCFLGGFVFIPLFGLRGSISLGAVINVVLGLFCLILGIYMNRQTATPAFDKSLNVSKNKSPINAQAYFIMSMLGVSGFCALAYEVFWTRTLVFLFNSTVYSFAIMLGTFLLGLATGSICLSGYIDKCKKPVMLFAMLECGIGIVSIVALLFLPHTNTLLAALDPFFKGTLHITPWISWLMARFCIALVLIFPQTLLFGATFPVVNKICISDIPDLGTRSGRIYSINTIGSFIGSIVAGFLLIPLLGIQRGLFAIAVLNLIIGIVLIFNGEFKKQLVKVIVTVVITVAGITAYTNILFDKPLLLFGATFSSQGNRSQKIVTYKEDVGATVSVVKNHTGERFLNIDGFNAAGTSRYEYMRMLGHLPMMLHCGPVKKALVICFGTGTTTGTLGMYHPERIDCAEISHAVINAAPYFRDVNHDITHNKIFHPIITDGRVHLKRTSEKYDIITLEPMHPYVSSAVNLYSYEFYRLCKQRLNKNGIMCQWIPMHVMTSEDHRSLVKSVAAVFPYTTVWFVNSESIVIGSSEKINVDINQIRAKMSETSILNDLQQIGMGNPYTVMNSFVLGENGIKKYCASGSIITDDRPVVEFSTPKCLVTPTAALWVHNVEQLTDCIEPVTSICINATSGQIDTITHYYQNNESIYIGKMLHSQGLFDKSLEYFTKALMFNPDDNAVSYSMKYLTEDMALYYCMIGKQYKKNNNTEQAFSYFTKALHFDSLCVQAHIEMGVLFNENKQFSETEKEFNRVIQIKPDLPDGYFNIGIVFENRGDTLKAIESYNKAIEVDSQYTSAYVNLARLYKESNNSQKAYELLKIGREKD